MSTAALALGAALVLVPSRARASESFPGAVLEYIQQKNPEVVCPVPCTLCHTGPQGGKGTARDRGFIENMRQLAQVRENEPATIAPALAALEANQDCPTAPGKPCDSDGDGVPDIQELRLSRDPDGSRNFDDCLKYGCGATIAPERPERSDLAPLWLVTALATTAITRRTRRTRRTKR